jgi:hypothetical protein
MISDTTLLCKGMECLTENLGLVEAEKFITLIHNESFDYTIWRRDNLFKGLTVEELSKKAMDYRQTVKRNYHA